jgi:hypothetical protein
MTGPTADRVQCVCGRSTLARNWPKHLLARSAGYAGPHAIFQPVPRLPDEHARLLQRFVLADEDAALMSTRGGRILRTRLAARLSKLSILAWAKAVLEEQEGE